VIHVKIFGNGVFKVVNAPREPELQTESMMELYNTPEENMRLKLAKEELKGKNDE
jgi:hypothetical protein|tara:strand:+ start:71 stop:235 length:165 start_codon:yes stop_codon:yes gene_type:complete